MARGEFAAPLLRVHIDSHAVEIPCRPPCTCRDSYTATHGHHPHGIKFKVTDSEAAPPTTAAEHCPTVSGRIIVHSDAAAMPLADRSPDLVIRFIGREHVDVLSDELALEDTATVCTVEARQTWRPWIPGQTNDMEYFYSIRLPDWLPPSVSATWGAIDYRVTAYFDVPLAVGDVETSSGVDRETWAELRAQKRIEVVRTHPTVSPAAGPLIPCEAPVGDSFRVLLEAPEQAFVDVGNIPFRIQVTKLQPADSIKSVRVAVYEIRNYRNIRVAAKGDTDVATEKNEAVKLAEHKVHLDSNGHASMGLALAGADRLFWKADGTLLVINPSVKGQLISIHHEVAVKIVYHGGRVERRGRFGLSFLAPNPQALLAVPIAFTTRYFPPKIGRS
ncbi:hypothetical protein HDU96_006978 [Phlyctochytrium bullatum]|nr:hypothetical protein HDU96_006978 [Phlyctochytrium bullatum]